jgi:hypothetical protein
MDLGNQDMKKNSCKKYYKNILNKDYEGEISIGYLPNSYLAEKLLEHFFIPRINLQNSLCILS